MNLSSLSKRFNTFIHSERTARALRSVWLFPVILTLVMLLLVTFRISGSSIGYYHKVFYGDTADKSLLFNHPQSIRSDEYSVNSQMAIAQSKNDFAESNKNVGNGEDMTILADIPYKGWSTIFHPQNLGFLFLPFDNAFALKWWLPGYLVIISAYFFALKVLKRKKVLSILLALSFILSPFFQWWYLTPTLGTVAYSLFAILVFLRILHAKSRYHALAWSALFAYIAVSFILIFYPPFQIACGLAAAAFLTGYLVANKTVFKEKTTKRNLLFIAGAVIVSIGIVGIFMLQKLPVVEAISNTVYPGTRVLKSGEGTIERFFSSNTSPVLQSGDRYRALGVSTNQSELSSFILVTPFLLIPAILILYRQRKRRKEYTPIIIAVLSVYALFLLWLLVPSVPLIGKITLLDKVSGNRLMIGIGLVNFMLTALFLRLFSESRVRFSKSSIRIYCLLIVIFYLLLNAHIAIHFPGFLGFKSLALLALPFPIIVYLFLTRRYTLSMLALFLFTLASTILVNPLYVGTDVLAKSEISQAIQRVNKEDPKKWVGDDNYLENFTIMSGAQSLNATYLYPQLDLWKQIDKDGSQSRAYNRYAHVNFAFDRDIKETIKPYFYQPGNDQYYIITEACDAFLKNNNVGYLITNRPFKKDEAPCATLKQFVKYPKLKAYIYKLSF